jgi:hypothetical protein
MNVGATKSKSRSTLGKLGVALVGLFLVGITLLYLTVRPPASPYFTEVDCKSISGWRHFPIADDWGDVDRKLLYLIEPQPAFTSDIRHYVLETNPEAAPRCFVLYGYSDLETPGERQGHNLVIYTKHHEKPGWSGAYVNQLGWWQRNFGDAPIGGSHPVSVTPEMQAATVGKPAGVYEWKGGNLLWVAPLGSTQNLRDVMFHGDLFDVISHSGIYYVSPPGMSVLTVIDLRSVGMQ